MTMDKDQLKTPTDTNIHTSSYIYIYIKVNHEIFPYINLLINIQVCKSKI